MSKCKIPHKIISNPLEQHVQEIIEILNEFSNMSNNKTQKNVIQNIKKHFVNFIDIRYSNAPCGVFNLTEQRND